MKTVNTKNNVFSIEKLFLIIILIVTFITYFQILDFGFIKWDDDTQITENNFVKNFDWLSISHNLHQERYTFIPLTVFSLIFKFFGNNPLPFHFISLIFHLLNILIIFLLTKKITGNVKIVLLTTLLFALHPFRVESVAWISELKDLMFTFFSLIGFIFYIKYLQNNKLKYFVVASICILLASFSKIQGLIVPFSLFLFDLYYKRKFSFELIFEKIILLFSIFLFFQVKTYIILGVVITFYYIFKNKPIKINISKKNVIITLSSLLLITLCYTLYYLIFNKAGLWAQNNISQNSFSIIERFFLAGFALWFYISNFIFPYKINAVHPYPTRLIDGTLPSEYYFSSIFLIVVLAISLFIVVKRKKISNLIPFGWFFFLFNISIVLHFIPIEGRLVVADRYSYLAYFGLFIMASEVAEKYIIFHIKKYVLFVFIILLSILSISTYNRCSVWKDTKSVFTDVLQKDSKVPFAYLNLATIYLNQQNIDSAMLCYNQSIKLDSINPTVYFNRAFAFDMIGKNIEAVNDFKKVLQFDKNNLYKAVVYSYLGESYRKIGNDSLAINYYNLALKEDTVLSIGYNNRGTYFLNKNKLNEAIADFEKAIKINKYNYQALNNYGWVLTLQGKFNEASKYYNNSLEINSNYYYTYNNRGYNEFLLNNINSAIFDYNKALQINPYFTQAYLNRGWAYATSKNYKGAIDDFTFVLKIDKNNQLARNNRAYAFYYSNDYKNAVEDFKANISLYPNSAFAWQNIAWFHMQVKDFDKAILQFSKSIELDSTLINSYINLGYIWQEKNNLNFAENYFKKALKINPESADALFLIAELYRKQNKNILACDYYNKSSKLGHKQAAQAIELYCKK